MKINYTDPVDSSASDIRREDYAHDRDQQAMEYNEAITRRLISIEKNQIKCSKCGKEFSSGIINNQICPACKDKK